MTRLALATEPEYDRLEAPLRERGITPVHVPTEERTVQLDTASDADVDVGFVYPQRLPEGGVADALLDVPWVNDRETLLRSRYKAETLARLNSAGVPTPKTISVSNPLTTESLASVFDRFDGPVVVKPDYATRGEGVVKVDDYDSLSGVVDYLDLLHTNPAVEDRTYLVQEYLPGAADYRAMVLDGAYAGGVERRLPADSDGDRWKYNVHRGAEAVGAELPAAWHEIAERAADAIGSPYLGVDLLATDDRVVVTETNVRPTIDAAEKYEPDFFDRLVDVIRSTAD
ncbi:ATP-grasp domain-containing protein [Halovivax limisalsi]|uniref:ATP-grasp domain-containing protein n=1 Tax=Halovivax limisalsi TaxID=1453760 RepID=UPI001FFC3FF4|nr:RimK family alpha-L-glutamate ligase [Halovivax limisalsi]